MIDSGYFFVRNKSVTLIFEASLRLLGPTIISSNGSSSEFSDASADPYFKGKCRDISVCFCRYTI